MKDLGWGFILAWLFLLSAYVFFPNKEATEKPIVVESIPSDEPQEIRDPDEISMLAYNNVLGWQKDVNTTAVLNIITRSLKDGKITEKEYKEISEVVDRERYGNSKYELLNPKTKIYPRL